MHIGFKLTFFPTTITTRVKFMTLHQRGWPWFAEASSTYSLRHINACIPVLFRLVIQNSYYPRVSFALSYFIIYIQIPFSLSRLSISSWTQFYHAWNTVFIFRYGHLTTHILVTNTMHFEYFVRILRCILHKKTEACETIFPPKHTRIATQMG